MITGPDHIEELIAMYLAGEASPGDIVAVDRWRNESEANRKYFDHLQLIFERSASARATIPFDTDKAWEKVREKLPPGNKTIPIRRDHTGSGFSFLKIAAGVIILVAAGVFTYRFFAGARVESMEVLAGVETRPDTLPDGSNVFLNRETRIGYLFDKRSQTHTAKLSGEAYFNIHHDDDKTFIVEAGETFIKDIGTAFNVKAYPESNTIEVVVEEGEVLFYTSDNPGIYLKANGKGTYDKLTGKFTVGEPEPNATAYRTKFFSFSNHSLDEVVKTLNEVYDTRLRIDDNLKHCRLTVTFHQENIEEIAHVIAETLSASVIKESDGSIRLQGQGCGEAPSE